MASESARKVHWKLRSKLALAFGGLLFVVLVVAVGGVAWSSRIEHSIQVILSENFRSVRAVQDMKEAVERMDSGALFALTGDAERGRALVDEFSPKFLASLELELSNLTLPGEDVRAARIEAEYQRYEAGIRRVLDATLAPEDRRQTYYEDVLPAFEEIKRLADEILGMNQASMSEASRRARSLATTAQHQMVLALLVGTTLAIACVGFLARSIVRPLIRLTASARRIEQGDFDFVVEVRSGDEIGQLAEAFNSMAGRVRALRQTDQARLALAQRLSQLTVDSLPDGVLLLRPSFEVELANRRARQLLGVGPGDQLPESHREWLEPIVEEASRSGGVESREGYDRAIQLFVDGRECFFLPHAVSLEDPELGAMGITVILVDVTDLRRLDEMKSNLVATVSHELMTPLTSLAMALHILLGGRVGGVSADQRELLESARDDADRLRQILEGLLDVARLETGASGLDLADVEVETLVEDALEPLRGALADKGIRVTVEIAEDACRVVADPVRASLLLTNLVSNALKHTESGGSVSISSVGKGADRVEISVQDTGTGIPEEYQDRLFERFFRIPGERERGAGLGLAIAKEIAEAHGCRLWLDPRSASGATFRFELPTSATAAGSPARSHPAWGASWRSSAPST